VTFRRQAYLNQNMKRVFKFRCHKPDMFHSIEAFGVYDISKNIIRRSKRQTERGSA
jgi:hypothetical protein